MQSGIIFSTIVGISDVGLVRKNNEDRLLVAEPDAGLLLDEQYRMVRPLQFFKLLLVVSDGMGGYEGGEVASALTVDVIRSELTKLPKQLSPQSRLESAVEEANRIVWQQRKENPVLQSMGATVTAMLVERDIAYIAEVGDSRAYILRDGRIKQLTVDQTMVQLLIDSGTVSPEVAATSSHKNMLLQAIGSQEFLQIAVTSIQIQAGDLFLLCSDGLSGKLHSKEIKEVLEQANSLENTAAALINEAKNRGGDDNITVLLAKFDGNGLNTKIPDQRLTKQIQFLTRFDPELEAQPKSKIDIRPATFQDWVDCAVIDAYVRSKEQHEALRLLNDYGEYIIFRKGDLLVSQGEHGEEHYWLVSGRYRVLAELGSSEKQTVAFLVSPTDQRTDADIQQGNMLIRVKRQFFTASVNMLSAKERNATILCEDDENTVIRISYELYKRVARILGERFVIAVRNS